MADQVFTLVGVVVGAGTSFVVSGLGERIRYRREIKIRWDTHKLDTYVRYVVSVVQMARIAGQIAGQRGWDELAAPIDEQKAPRALDDAELERTAEFERLVMLGDQTCVTVAHDLNRRVWAMEWVVRGVQECSPAEWQAIRDSYVAALDAFHEQARKSLQVSGSFLGKRIVERPQVEKTEFDDLQ